MERLKRDPSFERKFAAAEANVRQKNANSEDFGWGEAKPIGGDLTARQKAELILEKELAQVEAERAKNEAAQVKLLLAKKEAEEKARLEKEEAEEMERRRRNPEKMLDRRTDRGREIRFNYDGDDVDGVPMEEEPRRRRSRSRDRRRNDDNRDYERSERHRDEERSNRHQERSDRHRERDDRRERSDRHRESRRDRRSRDRQGSRDRSRRDQNRGPDEIPEQDIYGRFQDSRAYERRSYDRSPLRTGKVKVVPIQYKTYEIEFDRIKNREREAEREARGEHRERREIRRPNQRDYNPRDSKYGDKVHLEDDSNLFDSRLSMMHRHTEHEDPSREALQKRIRENQRPPVDTEYTYDEKIAIVRAEGIDPRDRVLDHIFEKKRGSGEAAFHPTENYNGTVGAVRNHEIEKARWRPGTLSGKIKRAENDDDVPAEKDAELPW